MNPPPLLPADGLAIRGDWTLEVIAADGRVKARHTQRNSVVNDGLNWLREYLGRGFNPSEQPDPMAFIAIGSGSVPVSATDSALTSELARQVIENYDEGGTGVVILDTTFDGGGSDPVEGTITEAGLFNAETDGTMFARVVFPAVTKEESDNFKMTAVFTFTAAS